MFTDAEFAAAINKNIWDDVRATGRDGLHHISPELLDEMPLGTFFVGKDTDTATHIKVPGFCGILSKRDRRNVPAPSAYITPNGRIMPYFWRRIAGEGEAVSKLLMCGKPRRWGWIVAQQDPGYAMMKAFKIACAHRVDKPMRPTLLYRALGIREEPDAQG